jgi:hypothetical protein
MRRKFPYSCKRSTNEDQHKGNEMQLTATGITLPNNDWKIQSFKEIKSMSEETMCFTAVLVHLPSKVKFSIHNDGHGGSNFMTRVGTDATKYRAVEAEWKKFVEDCRPALAATVAHEEEYSDLYDTMDGYMLEDSVISLFAEEAAVRKALSKADVKACVRTSEDGPGEFGIYSVSPEVLKRSGKVKGEYWDKALENWVAL